MGDDRLYDRWDELSLLVEQALVLPEAERDEFCDTACGDDAELRSLLSDLLRDTGVSNAQVHQAIAHVSREVTQEESLVGQSVGAYTLIEPLGVGGMGAVYLATRADGEFDKKVAVKVVRRQLHGDDAMSMFRNERQSLANLYHPSIPTLVDAGALEDGRPYFVCDYIDGVAIDDYCQSHHLATAEILQLFWRVAEAVQHAHTNLILHLDIKPKNVLVQDDGTPSLLDFGVARMIGDDVGGGHAYSPSYASPEQIRGDRLSAASDVYSLGALLFHLLSGEKPFTVDSKAPTRTVFAKRTEFIDRLQNPAELKDIDADLRAIVRKAMSETPGDRYATVDSLLNDLNRYRKVLPVKAHNGGSAYRFGKFSRRHRLGLVLAAVGLIALMAFTAREVELRKQAQASAKAAEAALAQAAREAATSQQVSAFLSNVFELSNPGENRGNSVTARELLEQAAKNIDTDLASQPMVAATLNATMGRAYVGIGLIEQGLPMMEEARQLHIEAGDTESLNYAETLFRLGGVYDQLARHQESQEALAQSLKLRKKLLGDRHLDLVPVLTSYALLTTRTEDFELTESLLMEATNILTEHGQLNTLAHSEILHIFSRMYVGMSRFQEALEASQKDVAIKKSSDALPRAMGLSLRTLGIRYATLAQYDKALEVNFESKLILESILPPDHPDLANAYYSLSVIYLKTGDLTSAESAAIRAIDIQESNLGKQHPAVALSVSVLGEVYMKQGYLEKAEAPMKRALEIMRAVHPEEHSNVSFEKHMVAELYREMARFDEALVLIDDAIKYYAMTPGEIYNMLGEAKWRKGDILMDMGRVEEAGAIYKKQFEACVEQPMLNSADADYYATEYAEFLISQGKEANVEELRARLRKNKVIK